MIRSVVLLVVLSVVACASMLAQAGTPEVSFCPAGVRADGFLDWTKLPVAPPGQAVTATIDVTGVPGLTATIQVPALPPYNTSVNGGKSYMALNSANLSLPLPVSPTITFNRPVQGVSVNFQIAGRLGHKFAMTAYSATSQITSMAPAPAEVDESGLDFSVQQESIAPLQIRSAAKDLVAVAFQSPSDPIEFNGYKLVNFRIESGSGPDPSSVVPTDGLKQWLRSDRISFGLYYLNTGNVIRWPDQSGNGTDAVPTSDSNTPSVTPDGPNCNPVVSFGGAPSSLAFNLPINGWTEMTVFMAGQAYADDPGWYDNQALSWAETERWGTTFFTPSQTNVFFRFGTTQVNNQPIYQRSATIGGDFSVTTAVHNNNTDSLYVNGVLVQQQGNKLASISGVGSAATIGVGLNGTPFTGNIGEILIYNRALTAKERSAVERYLISKYGVR